ncbi:DUF2835 family protein [Neptunicella marina]|uniref:DUF2835 domain-containing protein n=1 Tax=Neptunicella marina TaxID=2125989 RepID=A0A8J6M102_9ALTE|nr:DUF2835 domain-containing protein [Neptunicella marina]
MKSYFFQLSLSYQQCENLYRPGINSVLLRAESGEKVRLPSSNLRPYTQSNGIHGRFRLLVSDNNKVKSFERVN